MVKNIHAFDKPLEINPQANKIFKIPLDKIQPLVILKPHLIVHLFIRPTGLDPNVINKQTNP